MDERKAPCFDFPSHIEHLYDRMTTFVSFMSQFPLKTFAGSAMTETTDSAVTRIRTWVVSATTRSTNHYTITAIAPAEDLTWRAQNQMGSLSQCA